MAIHRLENATPGRPVWPAGMPSAPATDSVAHKINKEIVVLLGWGSGVLMQVAHPLVAAGVSEHSTYVSNPGTRLRRMRQTVNAMLALTFGTPEEAARAAEGINRIHDHVSGRLDRTAGAFAAGTRYSAHDPELLRWVHATLMDVMPRAYETYVGPLSAEEKDRYLLEATSMESYLGIPPGYLPRSTSELRDYMGDMLSSGRIAVTPMAREIARQLLTPFLPRVAWTFFWPAQLSTVGLLPPAFREAYGLPWDRSRETAFRLSAALSRTTLPVLPSIARHWPAARATERRHERETYGRELHSHPDLSDPAALVH